MKISLTVGVLALVGACGGDDGGVQGGEFLDAGGMQNSGSMDAGSRQDSGSIQDSGNMPDSGTDAGVTGDAGFVPPAVPTQLMVKVEGGTCLGDCPSYSVSVDLSGHVDFVGGLCTKRPGVFSKQVPQADVLAFYGALNRSPYWSLPDILPNSALCPTPYVDGSSSWWSVTVDGRDKRFSNSSGCQVPVARQMAELEKELRVATVTEDWVSGGDFNCGYGYYQPLITEPSYRLSLGGQAVGVLKLDRSTQDWELTSCTGARISGGRAAVEPKHWDLVDEARKKIDLRAADAGTFGSIVVDGFLDAGVTGIRGLREDEDVVFTITPASGC